MGDVNLGELELTTDEGDPDGFAASYLRLGPRPPSEIREDANQHGLAWMTIRRAADELGVLRANAGPKSVWALPPGLLPLVNEEYE